MKLACARSSSLAIAAMTVWIAQRKSRSVLVVAASTHLAISQSDIDRQHPALREGRGVLGIRIEHARATALRQLLPLIEMGIGEAAALLEQVACPDPIDGIAVLVDLTDDQLQLIRGA